MMSIYLAQQLSKFSLRTKACISYFSTKPDIMPESPIVTVSEGKLRGSTKRLLDGSLYFSFKGIPYGQPPIGHLRFQAPLPIQSWQGTLQALEHGPECPHWDMTTQMFLEGNENCLFLNVYTKSLQKKSNLPVMVFIHGGGFMSGSGNDSMYGPELLVQHNIVLVTLNYRLEVLGFLCLDTPEVPGNAGMKDQVLALKWLQKNIEQFGGDPNNVTIFGESAGSASVTYHMLSPMSKGLFHKAIAHSGTCLADWSIGRDSVDRAFRVTKFLGNDAKDKNGVLDCLRNTPAKDLVKVTFKTTTLDEKRRDLPIHFAPVVEKQFDGVEAFLSEEPLDLLLTNRINNVPLIIGYNSIEACGMVQSRIKTLDLINKEPQYLLSREIAYRVSEDKRLEFGEKIKRFYAGPRDFSPDYVETLCNVDSDRHFVYNCHRFTNLYARYCKNIFMFKFSCDTELNFIKKMLGITQYGASHADDLFYLFLNAMNKDVLEENNDIRQLVFRITKMWTDFAKKGNPTPQNDKLTWQPFSLANKEYLNIDSKFTMDQYMEKERVEFWNKLYSEAGLPCITKSNL